MTPRQQLERAKHRMLMLREEVRSGATEMTGRTYRDASGRVAGRFKGGMSVLYPELRTAGMYPAEAARAFERGKGKRYRRLLEASRREVEREHGKARVRSRGRLLEQPHKGYAYCTHCREMHSKGEHRFHGKGSFDRTHLFSFGRLNPVKRVPDPKRYKSYINYLKAWARFRGWTLKQAIHYWKTGKMPKRRNPARGKGRGVLPRLRRWHIKRNPSRKRAPGTKIYERVLKVYAQKGPGHKCDSACKRASHKYYHVFTSKPRMYGLANGDVLIKG